MLRYILIRIALFIPTILIISLLAFFLKSLSSADPAAKLVGYGADEFYKTDDSFKKVAYDRMAAKLDQDKPLFYCALAPSSYPDALFAEPSPNRKKWIKRLARETGRGYGSVRLVKMLEEEAHENKRIGDLLYGSGIKGIYDLLAAQRNEGLNSGMMPAGDEELYRLAEDLYENKQLLQNWIPKFHWFGFDNQYHLWISGLFAGSFGLSISDGRDVSTLVKEAASWTLLMNGIALVVIFTIGILIGIYLSQAQKDPLGNIFTGTLYVFYAIPLFWLATMAVLFFTTNDYGSWSNLFPSVGQYDFPRNDGFMKKLGFSLTVLLLPILCIVLSNLAYVTIQMRNNMKAQYTKKYYQAARAKGLSNKSLVLGHALPHALYAMVHVLGSAIPALISGSVVVELIFNINGMGRLLWNALFIQDWSVVYVVVLLGAIFTMAGQLVADILYALIDPRVRFNVQGNT